MLNTEQKVDYVVKKILSLEDNDKADIKAIAEEIVSKLEGEARKKYVNNSLY
jgi:F420-0:gamma-glutamyl ligase